MKRSRFKRLIIVIITVVCFLVVSLPPAESLGGCWGQFHSGFKRWGGRSICPSDYKHANTNPEYKDYEPKPMTLYDAYKKGWEQYSSNGKIYNLTYAKSDERRGIKAGDLVMSEDEAKKAVYFFCQTSQGKKIQGIGRDNRLETNKDYNRAEIHPRKCPPDQYPYRIDALHFGCSGTNPYHLEPTPILNRFAIYSKRICSGNGVIDPLCKSGIVEDKYAGFCPIMKANDGRPSLPTCKPEHRMGYQVVQLNPRWALKTFLDCKRGEPGSGSSEEPTIGENEDKTCPTVKVKINGFPFQRVKVKRKKCS